MTRHLSVAEIMSNEDFGAWLKGCFDDDAKAQALIEGREALPESLSDDQRVFVEAVLTKARQELMKVSNGR